MIHWPLKWRHKKRAMTARSSLHEWENRMPLPGETCVFSEGSIYWKRDALLFDRVYAPLNKEAGHLSPPNIPLEFSLSILSLDEKDREERARLQKEYMQYASMAPEHFVLPYNEGKMSSKELEGGFEADRLMTERDFERGIMGAWSIADGNRYFQRFNDGQAIAYHGALNNLPLITTTISWDEVIEFKKDKESIRKLRDLRLWLNDCFKADSVGQATDLIAKKMKTTNGLFENTD